MISFLSLAKNYKSARGEESIEERSLVVEMRSDTRDSKEITF